jgi:hypothetical protein
MPSDSGSSAKASDVGRELGILSVQPQAEIVMESRMVADAPAIEAMFQWVRGNRDDRERVVVS